MLRNSKLYLLYLVPVLTLVSFVLVKPLVRVHGPVGLGIRRYADARGVVAVTNLTGAPLDYAVKVERKDKNGWPDYQAGLPDYALGGTLRPGESTNVSMLVMTYTPASALRVSVFCYWGNPTGPKSIVSDLLLRLHMRKLAKKMWSPFKVVRVSGPQMENCDADF